MKLVRRADQEFVERAADEHKQLLAQHERHVERIRDMNRESAQLVERTREKLTKDRKRLENERKLPEPPWSKLSAKMRAITRREAPPEPPPLPPLPLPEHEPIPEPPEPEFRVPDPETFEAEQFLVDESLDRSDPDVQDFVMIGPVRVQHGDYILTSARTGQMHVVAPGDVERHYVEP